MHTPIAEFGSAGDDRVSWVLTADKLHAAVARPRVYPDFVAESVSSFIVVRIVEVQHRFHAAREMS